MRLRIKDASPDWDGTSNVSIECDLKQAEAKGLGVAAPGFGEAYVTVSGLAGRLGARIKTIKSGEGIIVADRYLRRDLKVPEGTEIEAIPLVPATAAEITIGIGEDRFDQGDYTRLCYTYLNRQPLSKGQSKPIYLYSGQEVTVSIESVSPGDLGLMSRDTAIKLVQSGGHEKGILFGDIGGMEREIKLIRERVEMPLRQADRLSGMGIHPPRGVLLYGPPGCGKTMLARALCNEVGASLFQISGTEVYSKFYGESEARLKEIFAKAREKAPSVILIDEIDSIGSSRQLVFGDLERRLVTTLLTEMDDTRARKDVIVVATTNDPNVLDPSLRRPGRFDYEIRIGIPDAKGRKEILGIHTRKMAVDRKDAILSDVAKDTHGFTGADLMLLCREAAYCALQRHFNGAEAPDLASLGEIVVSYDDFLSARSRIKPTGMREFMVEVPTDLEWSDIGGLGQVKKTLVNEVIRSITDADAFRKAGVRPVRGILLYGPPGTGKTLLAKVIAGKSGANFIPVRGPEILSKWFGESEQKIRQIFAKAREASPCIVFFDEIDAITGVRGGLGSEAADRVVNQILTEMDGIESSKGVYVVAATNRRELLDPALLRPGRFDYQIFVPLPDVTAREEIFRIHLGNKKVARIIDHKHLAEETDGLSGAHIAEVCRHAGIQALSDAGFDPEKAVVTMGYLDEAIGIVKANISMLERPLSTKDVA
jgi:transitional endoplasmic reticulum ATPase